MADTQASIQRGGAGQREDFHLGGMERDGASQNTAQFKSYELFVSEIFHLLFSDHSQLWVMFMETKPRIRGIHYIFVNKEFQMLFMETTHLLINQSLTL